jgi:hypothetical protein
MRALPPGLVDPDVYWFHPITAELMSREEWLRVGGGDPHAASSYLWWKTRRAVWVSTVVLTARLDPVPAWETIVFDRRNHLPEELRMEFRWHSAEDAIAGHGLTCALVTKWLVRHGHTVTRHDEPNRTVGS